jgi:pimeloyl-ACP methyl ester carboxylesterase
MLKHYIFVHGLGLSGTIWEPLVAMVPCSALAPDLCGHGDGPRGRFDFLSMWRHIEDALPFESWKDSVLVLHSMSAAMLPELVASKILPAAVVLVEGNIISIDADWSRQISDLQLASYENYLCRLRCNHAMVLRSQLRNQHRNIDLVRWSDGFLKVDATALREIAKNLKTRSESGEISRALEQLHMPVCYLRGALSGNWDVGRDLLAQLNIPIFDIEASAHYPMLDNPTATWGAISSFN